jgi:hypothetical protein
LSGQVFSLGLNPDPPALQDVNDVLEELASGGLLTGQDEAGSYVPASRVARSCWRYLTGSMAASIWNGLIARKTAR